MRLLLQLSLAAADDGAVLERADSCSSILSRRMLHVQRVVRRRRRALRSRRVWHWLVRLLCEHSFAAADCAPNCHAVSHADDRSDGVADHRTDAIAVNGGVYDCLRLAGGIVRRFRRQLLRKPSHVRGRSRHIRGERLRSRMRLLLQLSLAAADDGAVLERANACSSIL